MLGTSTTISGRLTVRLSSFTPRSEWVASDFYYVHRRTHLVRQGKGLYVFDPKALNNIVIKDQLIFEEPRWFIQWVVS